MFKTRTLLLRFDDHRPLTKMKTGKCRLYSVKGEVGGGGGQEEVSGRGYRVFLGSPWLRLQKSTPDTRLDFSCNVVRNSCRSRIEFYCDIARNELLLMTPPKNLLHAPLIQKLHYVSGPLVSNCIHICFLPV